MSVAEMSAAALRELAGRHRWLEEMAEALGCPLASLQRQARRVGATLPPRLVDPERIQALRGQGLSMDSIAVLLAQEGRRRVSKDMVVGVFWRSKLPDPHPEAGRRTIGAQAGTEEERRARRASARTTALLKEGYALAEALATAAAEREAPLPALPQRSVAAADTRRAALSAGASPPAHPLRRNGVLRPIAGVAQLELAHRRTAEVESARRDAEERAARAAGRLAEAGAQGPLGTAATCQWIAGEPSADEGCKCGRPSQEGSSYCAAHHRRAYSGVPELAPRSAETRIEALWPTPGRQAAGRARA